MKKVKKFVLSKMEWMLKSIFPSLLWFLFNGRKSELENYELMFPCGKDTWKFQLMFNFSGMCCDLIKKAVIATLIGPIFLAVVHVIVPYQTIYFFAKTVFVEAYPFLKMFFEIFEDSISFSLIRENVPKAIWIIVMILLIFYLSVHLYMKKHYSQNFSIYNINN